MPKDNSPPAFLFYPDDFSSDGLVEAMTTEEVGAYMLLLCKAWRESPPGSIPDDDRKLSRWARMASDRWSECRLSVLAPFKLGTDGRWHQKRMRREYDKPAEKGKKAERSARARWGPMRTHSDGIANAERSECSSSPSSSPVPKDPKPTPPTPSAEPQPQALPPPNVGSVSGFGSSHPAMRSQIPAGIARRIVDAHPNRAGGGKAIAATQDALRRIAGGLDHGWPSGTPPPANPAGWLLVKVLAYAASGDAKAGFGVGIVRWMDDAMYLDDEAAWNRPRAGAGDDDAKRVKLEKMLEALQ